MPELNLCCCEFDISERYAEFTSEEINYLKKQNRKLLDENLRLINELSDLRYNYDGLLKVVQESSKAMHSIGDMLLQGIKEGD